MRGVAVIMAVLLPVNCGYAQTVSLWCNSPMGTKVFAIDVLNNSVHEGNDPSAGWFMNNRVINVPPDPSQDVHKPGTNTAAYVNCGYTETQFVTINATTISFGSAASVTNACGKVNKDGTMQYPVGTSYGRNADAETSSIDRNTNILTQQTPLYGYLQYQCQPYQPMQ